jgi:hypothetical protein
MTEEESLVEKEILEENDKDEEDDKDIHNKIEENLAAIEEASEKEERIATLVERALNDANTYRRSTNGR